MGSESEEALDPLMVLGCPHGAPAPSGRAEQTRRAPVSCYSCPLPGDLQPYLDRSTAPG